MLILGGFVAWLVPAASAVGADVVATVDGRPVRSADVQRELDKALPDKDVADAVRQSLRATALQQLIDRQLILVYLERKNLAAPDQEIDLAVSRIEKQLATQDKTLADFLEQSRLTGDEFRAALNWQVNWNRYLARYLTDDNLQRYFEQHRREFDGTKLRVSHILFKAEDRSDAQQIDRLVEKAHQVRKKIVENELTFQDAAALYSAAPTAKEGGDIGLIGRREPMPEPFSEAAFSLDVGQLSEPVVSPFGVHLIRCTEVKRGDKSWQQVRGELRTAVINYLFRWTADQQRPLSKIEYLGSNADP